MITRGDETLTLNTRPTLVLRRAGIEPTDRMLRDRTGDAQMEALLTARLTHNRMTEGSEVIRVTGSGPNASYVG